MMMLRHHLPPTLLGLALLLSAACDHHDDLGPGHEDEVGEDALARAADSPAAEHAPAAAASPAAPRHDPQDPQKHHEDLLGRERAVLPGAKPAFDELAALIATKYVDGPLTEDELYTAAMEGVLARLEQLPGHRINELLSPREHHELLVGTSGRLVGVGIMLERVAGVVVVREVITGGPAERSGLRAGDRILGIDAERISELDLETVADRIRGPEGSTVELFVQRDTEEWNETITRGLVEVPSVQSTVLSEGLGYLRITSFSKQTVAELDEQLASLADRGTSRLVLDLRNCPGGLLDPAVETLGRFVPPDRPVLTIHERGREPLVRRSEGEHPSQAWPLVVLIGPKTASGAEIVADAIHEHDGAVLLGEPTFGKHTIESVHELPEGWAVKLSVSRFATASGQSTQGLGVQPDIRVPSDQTAKLAPIHQLDPRADPPLAAAITLLRE
ncbi:S41 family peptidase [Paraliomyxa miuraensis]|uniref:S41 family peptidase n=1 Tax=Paraliomyxa miuraensis TaxID=376150 RepID=UPI0022523A7D|nr:S41 family peptidase [Paraliomyxa miuraensis]MCX4242626.1 S41 family peptidase [Paraliomyxa miuraensis]